MSFLLAAGGRKAVIKSVIFGRKRLQEKCGGAYCSTALTAIAGCYARKLSLKGISSLPRLQKGWSTRIIFDLSA